MHGQGQRLEELPTCMWFLLDNFYNLFLDQELIPYRYSLYVFVFGVFSPGCFEMSVPVQVIAWKVSSLKGPVMCRVGRKTLYSLTHSLLLLFLFLCFLSVRHSSKKQ